MSRPDRIKHQFVEFVPATLEPGTIYVSVEYATCQHLCLCGCGEKVITPLTPTDWELTFDGEAISLDPSIGNWSFDCQSHYMIRRGRVRWAEAWSKERIDANRRRDQRRKATYYGAADDEPNHRERLAAPEDDEPGVIWRALARLGLRRRR